MNPANPAFDAGFAGMYTYRAMSHEYPRHAETEVRTLLREFPVVAILGPRQAGKTTLANRILRGFPASIHLDLELPSDLRKLGDAESYLRLHQDELVCLDEVQRAPEIFPLIRALIDHDRRPARFLLLGSASREVLRQSTESLAGRIAYVYLSPFTAIEVPQTVDTQTHWMRGGFPPSLFASSDDASYRWREQFVRTYLDRDIPALGLDLTRAAVERLWTMLAAGSGSLLNRTKLADPIGVSTRTIQRYIDILEATFMVRVLRQYHANTKKRLVTSPKVYVRDSGILHALARIRTWDDLYGSPLIGASWESYAIEQLLTALPRWEASFYRTADGAEIDLVLYGDRTVAIEMKSSSAPRVSRGFHIAAKDVEAAEKYVVAPLAEPDTYPIAGNTLVTTPDLLVRRLLSAE